MSEKNKATLLKANAAISAGDHEGFLVHCTEDTEWTFVGEQTLKGKKAVRRWMKSNYVEPPRFKAARLIGDGDFLAALGTITLKDENGKASQHAYCDVWRFRRGKLAGLQAFVVQTKAASKRRKRRK